MGCFPVFFYFFVFCKKMSISEAREAGGPGVVEIEDVFVEISLKKKKRAPRKFFAQTLDC